MHRSYLPEDIRNPYPDDFANITDVTYEAGMMLVRLKDVVRLRKGEDADYIVGADYKISYRLDNGARHEITVPHGLITDLASVPAFFRWFAGKVGPHLEAAIVHDYLYVAWQDLDGRPPHERDRAFADHIMLAAMEAAEVSRFKRKAIFWAVRLFGKKAFWDDDPKRYLDLGTPDVVAQFPNGVGSALA